MENRVAELSEIERKVLSFLDSKKRDFEDISSSTGVPIDSVRRAAAWLGEKRFAEISEAKGDKLSLTSEGEKSLEKGMP